MWLLVESAALGTLRDGGGPPGPPDGYGMFCSFVNISAFCCCSFVSPNKFHVLTVKQLFLCVRWTSLRR